MGMKVQRNAKHALVEQERNSEEANIELLQIISDPLMMELHYEIYMPVLAVHPWFRCYNEVNPACLRKVCHTAVSLLSVSKGDIIFHDLETPNNPQMLFVIKGQLEYLQGSDSLDMD